MNLADQLNFLLAETKKAERRSDRSMKAQRRNPNKATTQRAIDDYNAYSAALTAYNTAMEEAIG